MSRVLSS